MSTLDELKIKYFNDMIKLEQDKTRIIKLEQMEKRKPKKGMEIRDFFGGPPKFNPYPKKKVVTYECVCCDNIVEREGVFCNQDDCY